MKAIVHQTFGHIFCFNFSALFEWPEINDEFMCAGAIGTEVKNIIGASEFTAHVIRIQDCEFGCFS